MISLEDIRVEFGGEVLFGDISFFIREGEKIGLVGNNGSGKSTLLKVINGDLEPSGGLVNLAGSLTIGYLPQHMKHQEDETIYDNVFHSLEQISYLHRGIEQINQQVADRSDYDSPAYARLLDKLSSMTEKYHMLGGDRIDSAIERTLTGLGFDQEDLSKPMHTFSGGWKMRVELARILLKEPDVLLLDEPTNHLDIESIQWFENYLTRFQGAVILISHDRAFLDAITNRTIELSRGRLYDFKLPYSQYKVERGKLREQQRAARENQQKKIRETEEFIERFRYKANKASLVQSRIKQLEKMSEVQVDEEDHQAMHIRFPDPPRSGREVLKARDVEKHYGQNLVLDRVDFLIERGESVAFVGRNGEGKTTMARVLVGETDFSGEVITGYNVEVGYYAQNQDEFLDDRLTVFQTLDQIAVGEVRKHVRSILGAFLFQGEDVDKRVGVLSGGERSRLALARLLLHPYNMLILDEPTNHLDMRSKEVLKNALKAYPGTLLVISHDRDFMDGLVSKVYEFKNHQINEHIGGIYDFLRKRQLSRLNDLNAAASRTSSEKKAPGTAGSKDNYEKRKGHNKKIRKVEKDIEKTEQRIRELEEQIGEMDRLLANPEQVDDPDVYARYDQIRLEHEQQMAQWEKLHARLEALN
ncbi:MAG TPA: ABC-F family ATP-binding cassette domain-containing protein, partial [Bacteroidales bacterium]|nr:ABC-F family ATP-binding cassette domain-containing protein [Bacteroidales bacterium]